MSTHAQKIHTNASTPKTNPFGNEYRKKAANDVLGRTRRDANAAGAINFEIFGQFAEMMADQNYLRPAHGASRDMQQITSEIMESYTRHMAKLVEFSNEAMKCHSVMDMMTLNTKAMQYFCSDYVNETMKLSSKFFGNDAMARLCGFNNASEEICSALGA